MHAFIQMSITVVLSIAALGLEPVATCVVAIFVGCESFTCLTVGCIGIWLVYYNQFIRTAKNKAITETTQHPPNETAEHSSS